MHLNSGHAIFPTRDIPQPIPNYRFDRLIPTFPSKQYTNSAEDMLPRTNHSLKM